jgi:YesN/AraC family two-component response regulator
MLMTKNGKEAIEFIENENPDLILTDIMMGYVDGL